MLKNSIIVFALFSQIPTVMAAWTDYCSGAKQFSPEIPAPNYENPMVMQAAQKLSRVKSNSFVLYSDIQKVYGQCYGAKAENNECSAFQVRGKPDDVNMDAHNFLSILCAEFRDNETLMEAKLKWVADMIIVQKGEQTYDPAKGFWDQLTSQGYLKLLTLSESLYSARSDSNPAYDPYNSDSELDQESVPALTECEYKYLLSNFIVKGIEEIEDLAAYDEGYKAFAQSGECTAEQLANYNEFRGDGNFKPHSLESNAFIWNTRAFSRNCYTPAKASNQTVLTNQDCINYYSKPYQSRRDLTLQGMYRLFFYHPDSQATLSSYDDDLVFVTDDLNGDGVSELITFEYVEAEDQNSIEQNPGGYVSSLRKKSQEARKARQLKKSDIYESLMKAILLRSSIMEMKNLGLETAEVERVLVMTESQLVSKLPEVSAETKAKMQRMEEIKNEMAALRTQLEPLNQPLNDMRTQGYQIQDKIYALTNVIGQQNQAEIAVIQAQINELYKTNPVDYTKMDELRKQIAELREKGTPEQVAELASLKAEAATLSTKMGELQTQISPINEKLWALESESSTIEDGIDDTEFLRPEFEKLAKMSSFPGIKLDLSTMPGWDKNSFEASEDKGFFTVFSDKNVAWERLATVLDRHTDWYQIDMFVLKLGLYQPTYSPWVASSYYIHESDAFTEPGYAMGLEGDNHRHWMFVQKVPVERWYRASDLKEGKSFDLLNTWFDETTFSNSSLGASEKGWDRFGSASPDEMRALIYLYEMGEKDE